MVKTKSLYLIRGEKVMLDRDLGELYNSWYRAGRELSSFA